MLDIRQRQHSRSQIGRYEVIAEIGRGGMGVVYRAYEAALDRTIALKVISPELAHQPGFATRLRREAISAARLRHPNIALLYEFDQAEDLAFLAMEYVPGPSLRDLLEAGALAPDRAQNIIAQIGQALEYAHSMGVVHRDVKPSNILIGAGDHAVLSASTLVMPLVGALDTERLRMAQDQALRAIEQSAARYLILDITGVAMVDSQVAQGLIRVVQAARLLGAEVVLVGIRPEVAQAVVGLGIRMSTMVTRSTLQSGITYVRRGELG
jgi:serine/threonine protein kinase